MKQPAKISDRLTSLLKLVRGGEQPRTSDELRGALGSLDVEAMEARVVDLEQRRKRMLLTATDDELAKVEAEIAVAHREADRAVALKDELERRLAEAEAAEAAQARTVARQEAERLTKVAMSAIDVDLRAAFATIRGVVRKVAEADEAVAAVNEGTPGAQHLPSPETLRARAGWLSETVLSRKRVPRWAYKMTGNMVPEDRQDHVVVHGADYGILGDRPGTRYGIGYTPQPAAEVELRTFERVERLPALSASAPTALALLPLPPVLAGEPPGMPSVHFSERPGAILDALDKLEAELAAKHVDDRKPVVTFEPVPEPARLADAAG